MAARPYDIAPITVAIPVGPYPGNREWLSEALNSIAEQSVLPAEVLLIDDGQGVPLELPEAAITPRVWRAPWTLGVAHAFNYGVALARSDLVLMMGSDDKLMPGCIEALWQSWDQHKDPRGYYFLGVRYSDGRLDQNLACNAAMVHKDLWHLTGGFPVEAAVGAADTILISMMMVAQGGLGHFYQVSERALYWYRVHDGTDTAVRRPHWHAIVHHIRGRLTEQVAEGWRPFGWRKAGLAEGDPNG